MNRQFFSFYWSIIQFGLIDYLIHTALIALIMVHVLKALRISRRLCGWLVLPCLWFYTGATGWQSTAIRSAIMTTVIVVGWMLQRPGNLLNSLYASGFIILVWEPRQLFQASFQLSFFVVLSLALFGPFLEALRQRIFAPDPLLPDVLQKRKPAWLSGIAWFFSTSFISSLAAWLGSAPIIAYYFHLVTPVSLLANLIIVPLSTLALMCNSATLACGDWLPSIGELFNHSAWLWMKLMIVLSDVMAGWPGAYFYVRTPSLLEFSLYYFVLIALLCHWFQKYFLVSCPVLVVLIMSWCVQFFHAHRSIRITVLEAGGGDPILFNAPGKSDGLLVDCGSASSANFCIKPFLISQGINQLANVVLTHGDASQIGAFPVVHRHFKLQQLFISGVSFRSSPYRQILSEARDSGLPITAVHAGDFVGAWRVLHPTEGDRYSLADDATLVLKTKIHDVTLLLCSDLGPQGQRQLLEQPDSLHADVVIAGMPSKGEPLFDNLLSRINPQAIIICCSSFPVARTPRAALRQRLNESKTPVFYTSECGSVILQIQPGRCTIKTMSGEMLTISNKDRSPP